jgi:hypothetical protein
MLLFQNNRLTILEYLDTADVIRGRFGDLKQNSFIAQNEMRSCPRVPFWHYAVASQHSARIDRSEP